MIRGLSNMELRAIATRALAMCCDECRALLRAQLLSEESMHRHGCGNAVKAP
jgi:hypothetical protein